MNRRGNRTVVHYPIRIWALPRAMEYLEFLMVLLKVQLAKELAEQSATLSDSSG